IIGRWISPVFSPLGFNWKMTVGLISGFVAKEVVISTLGILYSSGGNLTAVLPGIITPLTALGYLVFILLYTPCLATVAVMKMETSSLKWTVFSIVYSLCLAWIAAFLVQIIGRIILHL
ncbi:MAG: nucleoside recognition domain-containing protein, partial [Spirochaetota bacterium]